MNLRDTQTKGSSLPDSTPIGVTHYTLQGKTYKKEYGQQRAKLAEKSRIVFFYGTDLLRSKQISNPGRFLNVLSGFLTMN